MVYLPFLSGIQRINKSFKRFSKFITCQFYFEAQAVWVIFSIVETAKATNLAPRDYIQLLFENLSDMKIQTHPEHLDQMLPWGKLIQENFA